MSSALFFSLLLVAANERPDLSGTVTTVGGRPVPSAAVWIYEAHLRNGTNACSAHAYADCTKQTVTDQQGRFRIRSLDPDLLFRVLILPSSHDAMFAEMVDPAAGPLEVTVSRRHVHDRELRCTIRGRVLDRQCRALAGAELTLVDGRTAGRPPASAAAIDASTVTSITGEFVITASEPIVHAVFRVEARGLAPRLTPKLTPDLFSHMIILRRGATVSGRIVHQGRPVPNVVVGLRHADRHPTACVGQMVIATDQDGRFRFEHVADRRHYHVFATMRSLHSLGAVAVSQVQLDGSGTGTDVGALQVQPGRQFQGQVVLQGLASLPGDSRLLISDTTTADTLSVPLGDDGRFTTSGLPPGDYTVCLKAPGLGVSPKTAPIDLHTRLAVKGTVVGDLGQLAVSLDPDLFRQPGDFRQSEAALVSEVALEPEPRTAFGRWPRREGAFPSGWEAKYGRGGMSAVMGAAHRAPGWPRPVVHRRPAASPPDGSRVFARPAPGPAGAGALHAAAGAGSR